MTDKELYAFMIKHCFVVVESLKRNKNVVNIIDNKENSKVKSLLYLRIDRGVKIVSIMRNEEYIRSLGYFTFKISKYAFINELIELDIDLYQIDGGCFACSIDLIEKVLQYASLNTPECRPEEVFKAPSNIYDLRTSGYRISNNYFSNYIDTIRNNIEQTKHPVCAFDGWFIGKKPGIEKFGVFAYQHLYTDFTWTFEMVEEYKTVINWKHLIEESNLEWEENQIIKYQSLIPFYIDKDTYRDKFHRETTVQDYCRISFLSNSFIEENKSILDWIIFLKTGSFIWNKDDLKYFYELVTNIEDPWSNSSKSTKAGGQLEYYFIRSLIDNLKFKWTIELLLVAFELDPKACYDFIKCPDDRRNKIYEIFMSIPNREQTINNYIQDSDFLLKLKDGDTVDFGAYSSNFTLENIKKNHTEWNNEIHKSIEIIKVLKHEYDDEYHTYRHQTFTMWDYFQKNSKIELTYEICKFLYSITITKGGQHFKGFLAKSYRDREGEFVDKQMNGLVCFKDHKIANGELSKICSDIELLDFYMSNEYYNYDVVDYMVNVFFADYTIEEYLEVLKGLNVM